AVLREPARVSRGDDRPGLALPGPSRLHREGPPRDLGAARRAPRRDDVQGLHPAPRALARDAAGRGPRPRHQARAPEGPQRLGRRAERARGERPREARVRPRWAVVPVAAAVLACSVQRRATDPQPTLPALTPAEVQPALPA